METGKITLISGVSGCGKSTFLFNRMPSESVILCPDEFRFALLGKDHYPPAEDMIWASVKLCARVLVQHQNKHVIIDATSLNKFSRGMWVKLARELDVEIDCIAFEVPLDICIARNNSRDRKVPLDVQQRQHKSYQRPSLDEGFASIDILNENGENIKSLRYNKECPTQAPTKPA